MKIIDIHKAITTNQLLQLVQGKLNPMFHEQRQAGINFIAEIKDDNVEISQPAIYDGFLFKVAINGSKLLITRSEHYVDDVNSLTVESILNTIFEELSGDKGVSISLEG